VTGVNWSWTPSGSVTKFGALPWANTCKAYRSRVERFGIWVTLAGVYLGSMISFPSSMLPNPRILPSSCRASQNAYCLAVALLACASLKTVGVRYVWVETIEVREPGANL